MGKTHFKLAPGLLPAHSNTAIKSAAHYNQHWQQWMSSTSSQYSYDRSTSYDSSWNRWMSSHSPSDSQSSTPFEEVPRDAILPIMSRLPVEEDKEDVIAAEPTRAGQLDYLTAEDQVEGLHPEHSIASTSQLKYTRARLPELDEDSLQLWKALHSFRSVSEDYSEGYTVAPRKKRVAPHPISEDMDESKCPAFADAASLSSQASLSLIKKLFNWSDLSDLPEDLEYTWYGVAFRSKRRPGSESVNFYEDDRRSHEEAVNSGGLLMYWYGRPSAKTGHNLATCIWTSRQEAIKASSLPLHARAAVHSRKAYESFELSRYAVRKVKGETKLRIEEWTE